MSNGAMPHMAKTNAGPGRRRDRGSPQAFLKGLMTPPPSFSECRDMRSPTRHSPDTLSIRSEELDDRASVSVSMSVSASASASELAASLYEGGCSPPTWRITRTGARDVGNWSPLHNLLGMSKEQQCLRDGAYLDDEYDQIDYDVDGEIDRASRLPLPKSESPEKQEKQTTPPPDERATPERRPGRDGDDYDDVVDDYDDVAYDDDDDDDNDDADRQMTTARSSPVADGLAVERSVSRSAEHEPEPEAARDNGFSLMLNIHAHTETDVVQSVISLTKSKYRWVTKSWSNVFLTMIMGAIGWTIFRTITSPGQPRPVPDLVKVAGVARSFEPMIHYSEHGTMQISELQATGLAVWDLSESVRTINITGGDSLVQSLDALSETIKSLALQLTSFFASVDGDIDQILIVIDWARRELNALPATPDQALATAYNNLYTVFSSLGIVENTATGLPNRFGIALTWLFGMSHGQHSHNSLRRIFNEFLTTLEETIESELKQSVSLFAVFEALDRHFHNIARTVVREVSNEDDKHDDLLSSMWTRILGAKAGEVRKYERNRELLQTVRERTVANKGQLVDHNQKLLSLKANLETLRKKLVSPLVRSENSSTLTIDEQIRGLDEASTHLGDLRRRQKAKLMEMLFNSGRRPVKLANGAPAFKVVNDRPYRA